MTTPSEVLKVLLCDPDENVCIQGSDEDRRLLQDAIRDVEQLEQYGRHIHKNRQDGTDYCALCGFDLRENIHKRTEEV